MAMQIPPKEGRDRVLVLVKALPHAGMQHGETVCCAGLTINGEWRRLYPIHFRRLTEKFKRWDWIKYSWRRPKNDLRPESQRVQEDTIQQDSSLAERERASFLNRLIEPSTEVAAHQGRTLTLIRPRNPKFYFQRKTAQQIENERRAYQAAARQKSFFDKELKALEPCPFAFKFDYLTEDGKKHTATCDDWETTATFRNWSRIEGEEQALAAMSQEFGERYPRMGMVFAMGTHSRRPEQWLLVGVIRLDISDQGSLL